MRRLSNMGCNDARVTTCQQCGCADASSITDHGNPTGFVLCRGCMIKVVIDRERAQKIEQNR